MKNSKKLAVAYAASVPNDIHVPTLTAIIEREELTSLEAVRRFVAGSETVKMAIEAAK